MRVTHITTTEGCTMKTNTTNFHSMRGHVADGCIIVAPDGREYTLINTISGWRIKNANGDEITGNLKSAFDVEFFVVNGLGVTQ